MKNIDIYDIFLEYIGWCNPKLNISDSILIENEEAISNLAQEIGININLDLYDLYLQDDDKNSTNEATIVILELSNQFGLGFDIKESESLMEEAHFNQKSNLTSGSFIRMNRMKDVLISKGFSAFIRKIEK